MIYSIYTCTDKIYFKEGTYNTFYTEHSVLNAESEEKKKLRLQLCKITADVIKKSMGLLGIKVPERM
ncbi:MAG: DALR anticodon-binding domain-containing protein [Chitinophagaceae bacterium]